MKSPDQSHYVSTNDFQLIPEAEGPAAGLVQSMQYQVDDWVKLELTAEQMLQKELALVTDYIATDAHEFVSDLKGGILTWELQFAQFLLSAADPIQLEWLRSRWWMRA